ncbi:uncharacterized protein LOC129787461 [Lutzomyia longipalpis]|uniref:uncharacterized protein LOC129787461 n=1 Tax=Lutzomyia longipalpis TaxID=7200 RepID=UPI0024846906|nr:uncharacterized protein LOC129787461 [Lutzomyia longipalpis]
MSKRCCARTCFNSQVNNKSGEVFYFGVPKYEKYAERWLTAAGREDLLSKPLVKLVKYFMCSDHFEDHCFVPGSKRSVLRKQMHPLEIPVPTIFKSNIDKFVPKATKIVQNQEESHRESGRRKAPNTSIIVKEETSISSVGEAPEIRILNQNFKKEVETKDDSNSIKEFYLTIEDENEMDEDEVQEINSPFIDMCRLCSVKVDDTKTTQLFPIFSRPDIVEKLNVILPGVIQENDGWPQEICNLCLKKVTYCATFISGFIAAQDVFMNMR